MRNGTHSTTRAEALRGRKWWLVDADGLTVGRTATRIATLLRGKHKPSYVPSLDTGDFVVVVNADKVRLTGRKEQQKLYKDYSGYMGGLKERTAAQVRERHPDRLVRDAVKGMIPKNRLGRAMVRKLKVYAGPTHPHEAQKVEAFPI